MKLNKDRREKRAGKGRGAVFSRFSVVVPVLIVTALLCICVVFLEGGGLRRKTAVSGSAGGKLVRKTYDGWSASFGIVKIICGDYWGSGVVIACDEDGLVIVSAKHLLMYDVQAEVIFAGAEREEADSATGQVIGYSASYDLAYLHVSWKDLTTGVGMRYRGWFEKDRSLPFQEQESESVENAFEAETVWNDEGQKTVVRTDRAYMELRAGENVVQIGMSESDFLKYRMGTVQAKEVFISDYNAFMLLNECLAEAGMSGGGAFDEYERLIGIIIAGDEQGTVCMPMAAVLKEYRDLLKES